MAEITMERQLRLLRIFLCIFIVGLAVSGVTAFPLETELRSFVGFLHRPAVESLATRLHLIAWFGRVLDALSSTNARYPFLSYGTDWLAFAHLVFALFFLGPLRDPVRNKWLLQAGLVACAGIFPLALIAGSIRGIPFGWRLIDCSFGLFGGICLIMALRLVRQLEQRATTDSTRA